jgi:hypothetical protein
MSKKVKTISEALKSVDNAKLEEKSAIKENAKPEPTIDENRQVVIDTLKDLGVDVDLNKSTETLTLDLRSHILKINNQIISKDVDSLKVKVRDVKNTSNLSDDAFIARLIELGVPMFYMREYLRNGSQFYLFADADSSLSDKQIWEKIRRSNINPLDSKSIFTKPIKRSEKYRRGFSQ